MVRGLFAEAEAELAACNGDVTKSALHVVGMFCCDEGFAPDGGSDLFSHPRSSH